MFQNLRDGIASAICRKLIIIIACFSLVFMQSFACVYAVTELSDYVPIISISIVDGTNAKVEYTLKQDSVENVLNELNITLNSLDKLNISKSQVLEDQDEIDIIRVTTETITENESIAYQTEYQGDNIWGETVACEGEDGILEKSYLITYENGQQVSKELTGSQVIKEAVNKVIRRDRIAEGLTFTGRLTTYGGDCGGCSGLSSSGVKLSASTGVNGSNSPYLTYNGNKYYCIATDKAIPYGTIIEISNHNLNLSSTIQAIVVDRGGAINGKVVDIFNGSESGSHQYFRSNSTNNAKFKIIKLGNGNPSFWK